MAPRPALDRLRVRPDPGSWADDELVTLSEAVALFMPHGPLTAASLRIAYHRGELAACEVRGRIFTTRRNLDAMMAPRLLATGDAGGGAAPPTPAPRFEALPRDVARRIAEARRRRGA